MKKMTSKVAVKSLAALAQESRLAIFRSLVQAGSEGLTAGQVAETLGISPSSLTFHMKELTHAGLAVSRQEGRYVIYSAQINSMNALLAYLRTTVVVVIAAHQSPPSACLLKPSCNSNKTHTND